MNIEHGTSNGEVRSNDLYSIICTYGTDEVKIPASYRRLMLASTTP